MNMQPEPAPESEIAEGAPRGAYTVLGVCGISFAFFAAMLFMTMRHQAAAPPIIIQTPTESMTGTTATLAPTQGSSRAGTPTAFASATATVAGGVMNNPPTATDTPIFKPTPTRIPKPTATPTKAPTPAPTPFPTRPPT